MLAPSLCAATPVQPRVRGERMTTSHTWPDGGGSAPRARGTESGIQPRVRGERAVSKPGSLVTRGSAPRARGTAAAFEWARWGRRFSPACAGNGSTPGSVRTSDTVQPRVRGERAVLVSAHQRVSGSAPRARGTAPPRAGRPSTPRFSPACAGNGSRGRPRTRCGPVQPRVRGERFLHISGFPYLIGSAPRARGTDELRSLDRLPERFSPACAGNGPPAAPRARSCTVQPRVRGERPSGRGT